MAIPIAYNSKFPPKLSEEEFRDLVYTALALPHTLRNITAVAVTYVQFPSLLLPLHRSNRGTLAITHTTQ